jgi:hypothetical protein
MKVEFIEPTLAQSFDADVDRILSLVRDAGASYWNDFSGSGLLTIRSDGAESRLSIYFVEGKGFRLVFSGNGRYVAAEPMTPIPKKRPVLIRLGGLPKRISNQQIVDRDTALEVVRYFIEHADASPIARWTPARSL